MSRTIGRKKPRNLPGGDYVTMCAYCGANWYRSQLRLDGSGKLFCPDEGDGLDAVTLDRMNAAEASRLRSSTRNAGLAQGPYVGESGKKVRITTAEEIYNPNYLDEFP